MFCIFWTFDMAKSVITKKLIAITLVSKYRQQSSNISFISIFTLYIGIGKCKVGVFGKRLVKDNNIVITQGVVFCFVSYGI